MEQWIFSNKGIAIKCGDSIGIESNNRHLFHVEGTVKLCLHFVIYVQVSLCIF
jgi:hypothetical protein